MKNTLNRINSRLETLEENAHELDGLWRKTTRNEALREKGLGKRSLAQQQAFWRLWLES